MAIVIGIASAASPARVSAICAGAITCFALIVDIKKGLGALTPALPLALVTVTSLTIPAILGLLDGNTSFGAGPRANVAATLAFAGFVVIATIFYMLFRASPGDRPAVAVVWSPQHALFAWFVMQAVSAAALLTLVATHGGFDGYLSALSDRMRSFAGQGLYVLLLLAGPAASLLLAAAHWTQRRHSNARALLYLVLPVFTSTLMVLATGNRMNLMVYFAALAYVYHTYRRRLALRTVLAGAASFLIIGLGLLPLLRGEGPITDRKFDTAAWQDTYANFQPVHTFGQQPALALLVEKGSEKYAGTTYLAAATILLPRQVAPWKLPDAGEVATKELLPRYWYQAGTGIQIGAPGEALLNFGIIGIPVCAGVFGLAMAAMGKLQASSLPLAPLIYALLLPRVALYLRGGFANVTAYLVMDLVVLAVAATVGARRRKAQSGHMARRRGARG